MPEALYFSLVFLAGVIGFCSALFALVYRDRPGAKPLVVLAVAASVWAIVEGLSVVQTGLETMTFWTAAALSLSVFVPPAFLGFVIEYTGNDRLLTPRLFAALLVEPVAFVALVWTNDSHRLIWTGTEITTYGPFDAVALELGLVFWAHQVYSYLLLAAAAVLLLRMLFRTNSLYQWQGTALLVAILVPMSVNALYSFGLFPPGLDPSGIAYVLSSLVLLVTVLERELLAVAPATREIGREAVLTDLDDAIVILDDADRIVDVNPAAKALFEGPSGGSRGHTLDAVSPALATTLEGDAEQVSLQLEREGRLRYYDVRVSDLDRAYGLVSGRVVSLRDVTDRRQREQRLDVLNRLLRHNVRNELNLVRGNVELARNRIEDEEADANLRDAIDAVDGIVDRTDKLGRFSRMLDSERGDRIDLAAELHEERRHGGLSPADGDVEFDLPGELVVTGGNALVAVFEELLSNAIEHNDSETPRATVRVNEERSDDSHVVVEVVDNGPGIDAQERETILAGRETPLQHSSGVGLWLVNWVVERAGGTVAFHNDDGCTVRVRLPRATSTARTDPVAT